MITAVLWALFTAFNSVVIFYFFALNGIYLITSVVAFRELRRYARRIPSIDVDDIITATGAPGVTIIAPAFNEELTCIGAVQSLLMLRYPDYEIVLVNDGSQDRTLDRLADHFELTPAPRFPTASLETAHVRGVYRSRTYPNLWVIDKVNGGRADAINVGINFCRTPLVCIIDADSILERDALMRVVRPFLEDHRTVGAGGIIRIANGCVIDRGFVASVRLPKSLIARFQVVEYLRSFLAGRVGWNSLGATFIISGAFGVWRRAILVEAGGLDRHTVGEDMELTLRVHRYCLEQRVPYRITFIPDPVLWTEVPETMRDLGRQRDRWHRGLIEVVHRHKHMMFRRPYGRIGMVVLPYLYLLEMLGPLVEFVGYFTIVFSIVAGITSSLWLLAFLFLALAFGVTVSIAAVALEELCFRRYPKFSDLVHLFGIAVLENLGHRQIVTFWRVYGFFSYLRGKKGWGGSLQRVGFGSERVLLSESSGGGTA